jgi:hypothetical protein
MFSAINKMLHKVGVNLAEKNDKVQSNFAEKNDTEQTKAHEK